jgi:adenosine deaminase
MSEMASAGLLVEIMLTSNAQILGVQGQSHPLLEYLRAGVPVALASDDEGVLRTDLTHEYMRAAQEFGLTYLELKTMARNSVSYSFLATSARARTQSRLEAGFVAFESQF